LLSGRGASVLLENKSETARYLTLTDTQPKDKKKMGNLTARVLTSVVVVPLLLLAVFWERIEGWWGIVFVASALGGWEIAGMTLGGERVADRVVGVVLSLSLGSSVFWWYPSHPHLVVAVMACGAMGLLIYCLYTTKEVESAGKRVSGLFVTTFYAGALFPFVALVRVLPNGSWWVVLTLAATWLGDTGAYFAGRFLGRHKLYPLVSPKKTWQGAIGGMLATVGAFLVAHFWFLQKIQFVEALIMGVVASVLGQSGDLCESLLKRSYGVKDSGNLLPGHFSSWAF
jgi:phosphatidate cytidylyltransferase